jgi:hypothetical protein
VLRSFELCPAIEINTGEIVEKLKRVIVGVARTRGVWVRFKEIEARTS